MLQAATEPFEQRPNEAEIIGAALEKIKGGLEELLQSQLVRLRELEGWRRS